MSTKNKWQRWLDDETDLPSIERISRRQADLRQIEHPSSHREGLRDNGGFKCKCCNVWVHNDPHLSGVGHRNHCPYCLHSRHLDALKAGDRLSACQATMHPLGLTLKRTRNKYAREESGELMLIHHCLGCGKLSINRIAADDNAECLLEAFNTSAVIPEDLRVQIVSEGIRLLDGNNMNIVLTRLYGGKVDIEEWVLVEQQYQDAR